MKRSRLKATSAKRRKRDASYPKARMATYIRADWICEAPRHADDCDGQAVQIHHREGRNIPDPHRLDNLIALSFACHTAAHMDPTWAYETGVSIRKNRGAA